MIQNISSIVIANTISIHLPLAHLGEGLSGRQLEVEVAMRGAETAISPQCCLCCCSLAHMLGGESSRGEWASISMPSMGNATTLGLWHPLQLGVLGRHLGLPNGWAAHDFCLTLWSHYSAQVAFQPSTTCWKCHNIPTSEAKYQANLDVLTWN